MAPKDSGISGDHDVEFPDALSTDSNEITREQVTDVYTAGTTDGIIYLQGGRTLNAADNPQLDQRKR